MKEEIIKGAIVVTGTEVLGTVAPLLKDLQTRKYSAEELQATLVQVIDVVNRNQEATTRLISNLQRQVTRLSQGLSGDNP